MAEELYVEDLLLIDRKFIYLFDDDYEDNLNW